MAIIKIVLTFMTAATLAPAGAAAHSSRQMIASPTRQCALAGAYRVDVTESDKLYSVVKDATSTVPFREQQRFFMDLSTRLTPPDMLAIECRGTEVTVGSSRAQRVTYRADGRTRRERTSGGAFVNSRVVLDQRSLTFVSNGKGDDNVNVAFHSIDGGRRLRVTRSIHAEQLTEPLVIETVYNKIADTVEWDIFGGRNLVKQIPSGAPSPAPGPVASRVSETEAGGESASALRESLEKWLAATNRGDIDAQMDFYMPELKAYYLTRNAPRNLVRAEKSKVFRGVRSIDIRAREPEIVFQNAGSEAVMRFVKEYRVERKAGTQSGAVIQELRWQRKGARWFIVSERDVRVLR